MIRTCLSCKNYRPVTIDDGRCRVDRRTIEPAAYPVMRHGEVCGRWQDAGQQYYIRIGWLKQHTLKNSEPGAVPTS